MSSSPAKPFEEATVVINGRTLSSGEAMSLRAAVTSFHNSMSNPDALGKDEHGRSMTAGYRRHAENFLVDMKVMERQ